MPVEDPPQQLLLTLPSPSLPCDTCGLSHRLPNAKP